MITPLTTSCVVSGEGRGPVSVDGRLLAASGDPLSGMKMEIVLPHSYGVREKDLAPGQAMDFASPRRVLQLVSDESGRFQGDFGEQTYQTSLWLFPPRGSVPAAPPAPTLLLRFPADPSECYVLLTDRASVQVMKPSGATIPLGESRLARAAVRAETVARSAPGTRAVVELVRAQD
jgi:hypothetical protein